MTQDNPSAPAPDDVYPAVRITVGDDGKVTRATLYAPGLPAGEYNVYPVGIEACATGAAAAPPPPAPAEPITGNWISADDYYRNVKALDEALNGPGGATRPLLIDVLSQVEQIVRKTGKPLLAPSPPAGAALTEALTEALAALDLLLDGVEFRGLPRDSGWRVARRAAKKARDAIAAHPATSPATELLDAHMRGWSEGYDASHPAPSPADAALRSALERVTANYRLTLAGKPVRDVAETLAECDAAMKGTTP